MCRRCLVNDWSDPMSPDDGPDEEGNTGWGHEVSFGGKKMADLVHGEPDGRQAAGPEEEEADIVPGDRSRAFRHAIGNVLIGGPDGADHQGNAFAYADISTAYPRI